MKKLFIPVESKVLNTSNKIKRTLLFCLPIVFIVASLLQLESYFFTQLTVHLTNKDGNLLQVYWKGIEENYDEANSKHTALPEGGDERIVSVIIPTSSFDALRLDPSNGIEPVLIHKIELRRGYDRVTWTTDTSFSHWYPLLNTNDFQVRDNQLFIVPSSSDSAIQVDGVVIPETGRNALWVLLFINLLLLIIFHKKILEVWKPALKKLPNLLPRIHLLFLFTYLASLLVRVFSQFHISYDFLSYHLPFALLRANLTTYVPHKMFADFFDGHPPLSAGTQALLIQLTSSLKSAGANNAVFFLALILGLKLLNLPALSLRWFVTAALAVPLVVLHFCSGLSDLVSASCLCLAFASLLTLTSRTDFDQRSAILFVLSAAAAMLSKFQTWPTVGVLGVSFLCLLVWKAGRKEISWRYAALFFLIFASSVSVWPLRNILYFGNPSYPLTMPVLPSLFAPGSPEMLSYKVIREGTLPLQLWEHSNLFNFVYSALELSRWETDIPMAYSLDGGHPDGVKFVHNRIGGWFYPTVLVLSLIFCVGIFYKLLPLLPVATFLIAVIVTAITQQSQELRYWLYIPLVLSFFFSITINQFPSILSAFAKTTIFCCMLWVAFFVPLADFRTIDFRAPMEHAPMEAREFWAAQSVAPNRTNPIHVCGKTPWTIFWSGPTFNQFPVQGCF